MLLVILFAIFSSAYEPIRNVQHIGPCVDSSWRRGTYDVELKPAQFCTSYSYGNKYVKVRLHDGRLVSLSGGAIAIVEEKP